MKSDLPSQALPPRTRSPRATTSAGVRAADLRDRTVAELEADLEAMIRHGKASIDLTPGEDGTPAIASLIAVWLLTEVGKALGTGKSPISLSKVENPEDLRSIGGVARLLHGVFHPASAVAS